MFIAKDELQHSPGLFAVCSVAAFNKAHEPAQAFREALTLFKHTSESASLKKSLEKVLESAVSLCAAEAALHFKNESAIANANSARTAWETICLENASAIQQLFGGVAQKQDELRVIFGVAVTVEEWLKDIGFAQLDEASQQEVYGESPVFSLSLLLPD